jgi:hypothetical protein
VGHVDFPEGNTQSKPPTIAFWPYSHIESDDELMRILEAMGTLALLTRHTPKDIADERERFQGLFELHQQFSEEAQQKTLRYVHELESRLAGLPGELEAGLDPEQIAKLLGESLRQHFLNSGIPDTVKGLQAISIATTTAQKELSAALRSFSDSRGAVAQIESADNRCVFAGKPGQSCKCPLA